MKLRSLSDLDQLLPESERLKKSFEQPLTTKSHDGKGQSVRLTLETAGRKGKTVTHISGFHHNPATMKEIASILKNYCGSGGTVKNGAIEIQGDKRDQAAKKLLEMNYVVK